MNSALLMIVLLAVFAAGASAGDVSPGDMLSPGDTAPDFELTGSDGRLYKLSDFTGKQAVVIAWFPKAFTGGCTKECLSFRENGRSLQKYNVAYFTASCDDAEKNTAFAKKLELDYAILSDPGRKVAQAYGVVHGLRRIPERWTFIIGRDGKIVYIDRSVKAADHASAVIEKLEELGIERKAP